MKFTSMLAIELLAMIENVPLNSVHGAQRMVDVRTLINIAVENHSITTTDWRALIETSVRLQNEFAFRKSEP